MPPPQRHYEPRLFLRSPKDAGGFIAARRKPMRGPGETANAPENRGIWKCSLKIKAGLPRRHPSPTAKGGGRSFGEGGSGRLAAPVQPAHTHDARAEQGHGGGFGNRIRGHPARAADIPVIIIAKGAKCEAVG